MTRPLKQGILEWKIAAGITPDENQVALLSVLLDQCIIDHKIPRDATDKIFDFCYANYGRASMPNFLKAWEQVKDAYWQKINAAKYKPDTTEVSPIAGLSLDNYLYFSECCRRRLGIKQAFAFPQAARQIELFEQKGLPEKISRYETMCIEHHARGVSRHGGEWLMRQWAQVLAQHRDNYGID